MASVPEKIARYHVLGRIAFGGMAEILLAKVLGPGGFQRPVVIKRVLPHMAAQRQFRDMFLDEARIVAAINHPNVVQVHELGREDEELYLVMEYLAGESVRSLCARAAARGIPVPLGLCAHIVAEACAGLHAAHEFTDPDGRPLPVVHRDVCPNNLIVTYDGSVKVVDFGIALAADRFTATRAGQVKGKAAYMAPEQCLGRKVDRRTDVFSLGVVLYELSTGHRLFADALEARVVGCVRREEVQPPSRLVPKFPKELESICMRALRFSPDERFPSAEEMRRALVRFQHQHGDELLPEEQLRRFMQRLFEDRVSEKTEMLRKLHAGSGISHIPAAEVAEDGSIPLAQPEFSQISSVLSESIPGEDRTRIPARRRQRARRRFGLLLGAVAVSATVSMFATEIVSGTALGLQETTSAYQETKGIDTAEPGAVPAIAPIPQTVSIALESVPEGAEVSIDGTSFGVTPVSVKLPREARVAHLRVRLAGYEVLEQRMGLDRDQRLLFPLSPRPVISVTDTEPSSPEGRVRPATDKESTSGGKKRTAAVEANVERVGPNLANESKAGSASPPPTSRTARASKQPGSSASAPAAAQKSARPASDSNKKSTSRTERQAAESRPAGTDDFFLFE